MPSDAVTHGRKRQRSESEENPALTVEDTGIESAQSKKKARLEEKRSLFVRSLPTGINNEALAEFFSQHFPVKHAVVVVDQKTKESRGYGFVTLADADDAVAAKNTLDKAEWDGKRIRIDIAEPRKRSTAEAIHEAESSKRARAEAQKPPKLIIRNLPWSIKTSEHLSQLFRSYGKVKYADLPQKNGKLRGFGFVTIRGKKNAENAVEGVNGKEIDGRTLAVDYAVDKATWDEQQEKEREKEEADAPPEGPDVDEAPAEEDEEDETSSAGSEEQKPQKGKDDGLDADLENFMKNHMQNMEDEDDEEDEEDEQGEADMNKRSLKPNTTDNTSTVFIRNLPFTTTDEQLKAFFSHFGAVRYARVVFDKVTEKAAGTGFVCFVRGPDAKDCIKNAPRSQASASNSKPSLLMDENADPTGKYTMDGRLLQVAQAVNKEEAANLADNSLAKRREKDKRRLYLLSEGAISRGSPLFDLLSPSEVQMRQASAAQRKKLILSNPSLHVSLTRLALRNLPRHYGSKELKELARKAIVGFATDVKEGRRQPLSKEENARDGKDAKELERQRKLKGKGIVRQAKVVFESNQGTKVDEKSGAGKSRGYGFIEYTSHHWALMGLRFLNGHQLQDESGRKQRLIAEFSIENVNVVQRRRAAEEKSAQISQERNKAGQEQEQQQQQQQAPAGAGRKTKGRQNVKKTNARQSSEKSGADHVSEPKQDKAEDIKQRLIARKRMTRKKKATVRGKK
ncbi:hypothetical protein E4U19_003786 [Claviceps sp. Clav32 group G5]|nr:hypothetical protein E4U19_003786 [Claviceps sp. Clav32 group G5]KAG6051766.1 hypothetical protein E4U39_007378 [Claviceps sp. Clav50 group G5]